MTETLHGLRVLNTRPQAQAYSLSLEINNAGGVSIECPTLEIQATSDEWVELLPKLNQVNYAIFTSPNAVHFAFYQLNHKQISWFNGIKVIAIGEGTAKALHHYQILIHAIPKHPDSEHLIALEDLKEIKNKTILLFKGTGGRDLLEHTLKMRGANLVILPVYQRLMPNFQQEVIDSIWHNNLVDIILITSEQSMLNLFNMFDKEALAWLQSKPFIVLSERIANSASLFGIEEVIISHPDKIMDALFAYLKD